MLPLSAIGSNITKRWSPARSKGPLLQRCRHLLVTECMSRRRRVEEDNQLTLVILHLEQLVINHIQDIMNPSKAYALQYDKDGLAMVPPVRLTRNHVFPMLEREIHLLQVKHRNGSTLRLRTHY